MVVCRYFQQGYCRFGQNCRNDHIYGTKYTYHANPAPQAPSAAPQATGITDEQLVTQVQSDMQSALRGGQWILSSYTPFKDKPLFPGLTDLSPEEARLFIYEAKKNNNLEQAVNYMNNLFTEAKYKYEQIQQANVDIIRVLRSLYKGESVPSPFSQTDQTISGVNNAASSIFRSAAQSTPMAVQNTNTAASVFSQGQQSIFNSQPDPAKDLFSRATNSVFGQSPNTFGGSPQANTAKSIFASAVQNTNNQSSPSGLFSSANQSIFGAPAPPNNTSPFGQAQASSPFGQAQNSSPFGQTQNSSPFGQPQNTSPFGQAQNPTPFGQPQNTSPFGQGQNNTPFGQVQSSSSFAQGQNSSPFNQPQAQNNSPFSQAPTASPFSTSNVFQKTESASSIFATANNQIPASNDPGVYSMTEELSEADLEAFKSDNFELGFVPELPPPSQLCSRAL